MKIKLSTSKAPSQAGSPPATPAPATPSIGGGFKLKIRTSAPPTPVTEHAPAVEPLAPPPKPKRPYNKKAKDENDNKRSADDDIAPQAKRPAIDEPKRRISFKINTDVSDTIDVAPASTPRIKIAPIKRQSSGPKNFTLTAKKRAAPRPVGVGYDSEASDAEADPAIEQQFVLRMPDPSTFEEPTRTRVKEDTTYLHKAIEEKRLGPLSEGGADIAFRFATKDLRRAVVTIRGQRYTAALVDLPCVIESLKSWDRKGGWWKVADVAQVLLVLGPIPPGENPDDAAKRAQLPRDVDRDMRYAHGITPPMQYVRKRRFRKRVSHRDIENVEEQVERLLQEDRECELKGGEVRFKIHDGALPTPSVAGDFDPDASFMETTEDLFGQRITDEEEDAPGSDDDALNDALMAGLENLDDDDADDEPAAPESSIAGGASSSATPAPQAAPETSSDEDDEEEDEDSDNGPSGPAPDEDEVAEANERAAQREEIADLEREVRHKRDELGRVTNQLLKVRVRQNLRALEEELEMKRKAFGMEEGESEEED